MHVTLPRLLQVRQPPPMGASAVAATEVTKVTMSSRIATESIETRELFT
jgi:hypothetical protein